MLEISTFAWMALLLLVVMTEIAFWSNLRKKLNLSSRKQNDAMMRTQRENQNVKNTRSQNAPTSFLLVI
jgi:uncharacterized membrane protein